MRTLGKMLARVAAIALVGGLAAWWAARHSVVRTDWGTVLLEKPFITFAQTRVDARGWHYADYKAHPAVLRAMNEQGYADLLLSLRVRDARDRAHAAARKAEAKVREWAGAVADWFSDWPGGARTRKPGA